MDSTETGEYLKRKGAVQVILEIHPSTANFDELDDAVTVSSSTLSKRLTEAVELGLLNVDYRPTDYGTEKRYTLEKPGHRIYQRMIEIEFDTTVEEYQRILRRYKQERERLVDRVNRDTLIRSAETPDYNRPPEGERQEQTKSDEQLRKMAEEALSTRLEKDLIAPADDGSESDEDDRGETDFEHEA